MNFTDVPQCKTCPIGAICKDRSCALQWESLNCTSQGGDRIAGNWTRQPLSSGDNHYTLTSCPPGTELQSEEEMGTPDLQQCKPCTLGTEYIIDPDRDVCEKCPIGSRSLFCPFSVCTLFTYFLLAQAWTARESGQTRRFCSPTFVSCGQGRFPQWS